MVYPALDKNMITIAIDFDEQCQERFGEDYDYADHIDELYTQNSDDTAESTTAQDGREGTDSETSIGTGSDCTDESAARPVPVDN